MNISNSIELPSVGEQENHKMTNEEVQDSTPPLSPAVRFIVDTNRLDAKVIPASGRDGRILKGDILMYLSKSKSTPRNNQKIAVQPDVPPVRQQPLPTLSKNCPYTDSILLNII